MGLRSHLVGGDDREVGVVRDQETWLPSEQGSHWAPYSEMTPFPLSAPRMTWVLFSFKHEETEAHRNWEAAITQLVNSRITENPGLDPSPCAALTVDARWKAGTSGQSQTRGPTAWAAGARLLPWVAGRLSLGPPISTGPVRMVSPPRKCGSFLPSRWIPDLRTKMLCSEGH
jgi:hypothetical protein